MIEAVRKPAEALRKGAEAKFARCGSIAEGCGRVRKHGKPPFAYIRAGKLEGARGEYIPPLKGGYIPPPQKPGSCRSDRP